MKTLTLTPKNRLFDHLVTYISTISSIGLIIEGYIDDRTKVSLYKDEEYASIMGNPEVTAIELRFKPALTLKVLARNLWPSSLTIEQTSISNKTSSKHTLTNLKSVHGSIISNCFISFFEEFKPSNERSKLWQFAGVVRNALAHDGKIDIRNDGSYEWKTWSIQGLIMGKTFFIKI